MRMMELQTKAGRFMIQTPGIVWRGRCDNRYNLRHS